MARCALTSFRSLLGTHTAGHSLTQPKFRQLFSPAARSPSDPPFNSTLLLFCVTFTAASLSVAAWLFAPYDSWTPFHSFRRSFSSHPPLSTRTAASQRYKSVTQLIHHSPSDFVSRSPYPSSSTFVGRSVSHATVSPSYST